MESLSSLASLFNSGLMPTKITANYCSLVRALTPIMANGVEAGVRPAAPVLPGMEEAPGNAPRRPRGHLPFGPPPFLDRAPARRVPPRRRSKARGRAAL